MIQNSFVLPVLVSLCDLCAQISRAGNAAAESLGNRQWCDGPPVGKGATFRASTSAVNDIGAQTFLSVLTECAFVFVLFIFSVFRERDVRD